MGKLLRQAQSSARTSTLTQSDHRHAGVLEQSHDAIQGLVQAALSKGGFETATAGTGQEAATLLKGSLVTYRALVTDISLPGWCNGWEVARAAREIDPKFPRGLHVRCGRRQMAGTRRTQ